MNAFLPKFCEMYEKKGTYKVDIWEVESTGIIKDIEVSRNSIPFVFISFF